MIHIIRVIIIVILKKYIVTINIHSNDDNVFVERYMGLPQNNPTGYTNSSVMTWVGNMTGRYKDMSNFRSLSDFCLKLV